MPAGELDTTFGFFGLSTASFAGEGASGNAVALAPGGAVVVAGSAREGRTRAFAVARFRANGTPDETFGSGHPAPGCVLIPWRYDGFQEARAVVVQPDGRIVVAGFVAGSGGFAVARLDPRGRLDPTFGNGGRVLTRRMRSEAANAMVLQSDGKIVVAGAGETTTGALRFGIARYLADGTLDPGFGNTGIVRVAIGSATSTLEGAVCYALGKDVSRGRLVAAGRVLTGGHQTAALVRLQANGSLDRGFGRNGRRLLDPWHAGQIASIAINANGNILAVGSPGHGSGFVAWSFDPRDGRFNTFGEGGEAIVSFADLGFPYAMPRGVAVHTGPTGEGIVIVGTASVSPFVTASLDEQHFVLARLELNGRLDSAFGRGGRAVTRHLIGRATAVAVQRDRKLVVAGTLATGQFLVARFLGA
jgi:uncharacterized delta-60 repeat protein